jgi:hypothetical protein
MQNIMDCYKDVLISSYGNLFINTIKIMLVEDMSNRPSSDDLSKILQKSRYFDKFYLDQNLIFPKIIINKLNCNNAERK